MHTRRYIRCHSCVSSITLPLNRCVSLLFMAASKSLVHGCFHRTLCSNVVVVSTRFSKREKHSIMNTNPLSQIFFGIVDKNLLPVTVIQDHWPLADRVVHVRRVYSGVQQEARVEGFTASPAIARILQKIKKQVKNRKVAAVVNEIGIRNLRPESWGEWKFGKSRLVTFACEPVFYQIPFLFASIVPQEIMIPQEGYMWPKAFSSL